MKNLFLALSIMLITSFVYASHNLDANVSHESYVEYMILTDDSGEDTCYARFCWNVSETQRQCTDWQEVPCNANFTIDAKRIK